MAIPRRLQISLDHTRYYHCMSRCVRQAYLCGKNNSTGDDFSHRQQWIEIRLALLIDIFAIDLLAYAIMSNHYHVVLFVDIERAKKWSDKDVADRWLRLFKGPTVEPDAELISEWRSRLSSISWFMRCVNEPLARVANKEDGCTGRFWDGRFRMQALLDDNALLRCMCYVDLNPIRAGLATTPEESAHTSIAARISGRDQHLGLLGGPSTRRSRVPIAATEYLRLVDFSGRLLRSDKRGFIAADVPPILERLGLDGDDWRFEMRHFGRWYCRAAGSMRAMQRYCRHLHQRWLHRMPRGGGTPLCVVVQGNND